MVYSKRRSKLTNRRKQRKDYRPVALVLSVMFLLFMIIVSPLEPVGQAYNANGNGAGAYKGLVISEVMSANSSALPDDNGSFGDWIELMNTSDEAINRFTVRPQ